MASSLFQVGNWPVTLIWGWALIQGLHRILPPGGSICHSEAKIPLSPSSSLFYDTTISLHSLPISCSAEEMAIWGSGIDSFRELWNEIFYAFLLSVFPLHGEWLANKITEGLSHRLTWFLVLVSPQYCLLSTSLPRNVQNYNLLSCHANPYTLSVKVSRPTEPNLIVGVLINDLYVLYNNTF